MSPDPIRNVRSEADRMRASGEVITVTIPSGGALSEVVRLNGRRILAVEMPAAWTAAGLTFLSGSDDAAMKPVYDDTGSEIAVATAAGRVTSVTGVRADALASLDRLQVRSGTAGSPVNQAADRTLALLLK